MGMSTTTCSLDRHLAILATAGAKPTPAYFQYPSIQCQGKIKEIAKAHGYDQLDLYKGNQAHVANKSPRLS
jgi:hypothetical protein